MKLKRNLSIFLKNDGFQPNIKFQSELSKPEINFLEDH